MLSRLFCVESVSVLLLLFDLIRSQCKKGFHRQLFHHTFLRVQQDVKYYNYSDLKITPSHLYYFIDHGQNINRSECTYISLFIPVKI